MTTNGFFETIKETEWGTKVFSLSTSIQYDYEERNAISD
jgi:hypothetical protein